MIESIKTEPSIASVYDTILNCCGQKYALAAAKEAEEILREYMVMEKVALVVVKGKLKFISRKKISIKK